MPALAFGPIIFYSLIGTILFYAKKISFNNQIITLGVSISAHAVISIVFGNWLGLVVQLAIALVAFLLLVYFFAGKTSGETMLTMASLFSLIPIPNGVIPALIVFGLLLVNAFIVFRKNKKELQATILNAVLSTGLSHTAPDYSHLPERSELDTTAKRVSLLPYILSVMTLASIYFLAQPLFLES